MNSLARRLNGLGIGRGDRVAIVLSNGLEPIVSFLAVTASGATAAPLNPAYKSEEFRFCLEDINAKALIRSAAGNDEIDGAVPESIIDIRVNLDENGRICYESTGTNGEAVTNQPSDPNDVALVLHTSGTTSRPKRVPLSHHNLVVSAKNVVDTYRLTCDDVSFCVMPLFHIHGLVASTLATLLSGGTVVVPSGFNAMDFWPTIDAHLVTWYSAVPTIHQALLHRSKRKSGGEAA